ncbi:DNA damage-inducible protein D [Anaerosinus massiliensis]|uniref:DNA damage-inducible protein D n=1 Tax=Massilibacillus massiliensis TaxID=1806837 RepID=UPI000AE7056C|nr:DNA damage-inducible protein D [Massilibacillus massiliensis]
MTDIMEYSMKIFEDSKYHDDHGTEFWYARELLVILEYTEWRNFEKVIHKAKIACKNSGNLLSNHFVDVNKMVEIGSGVQRGIEDVKLTRYACYLIVQNGDSRKKVVALGQTYFAVKTREQEVQEEFERLNEEQKRLAIRNELKNHNKSLAEAAKYAGVQEGKDYAIFQNSGYKGLYGGLGAKEIHAHKGLKKNQTILDHMGSTELAANLFRATQTDEKLRREKIKGKEKANQTHFSVGKKVRQTIAELGGTMPENLPVAEKSVKKIEAERRKRLDAGDEMR